MSSSILSSNVFMRLRSVEYLASNRSWTVQITCQSQTVNGVIRDPFSEEDERKLKHHLTDYYRVDPFDELGASVVADSLVRYTKDLFAQLEEILGIPDLDFPSQACTFHVITSQEEASIHRLHWEALEHPILPAKFAVCRVCTSSSPRILSDGPTRAEKSSLNLLFLTSRRIGGENADVAHRPILNSFLEVISQLPQDAGIGFDVVRPGTMHDLGECLKAKARGYYDLVHLDAHRRMGSSQEAELLLSSPDDPAKLEPIAAVDLGKIFQEHGVDSVLLNACDSARMDARVESNLAASLLKSGMQNVIGMSYPLNVSAAEIFVREFYESFLIERLHMATATARGRHALRQMKSRRARFRLTVEIEDWILPVFYTSVEGSMFDNVSLVLPMVNDPRASKRSFLSIRDLPVVELPLVGRDNDLLRLETCLLRHRCVEVNGPPGVGTTSLLKHAVAWWMHTKLIKCFSWHDMRSPPEAGGGGEDADEWWLSMFMDLLCAKGTLLVLDKMDYGDADTETIEETNYMLTMLVSAVSKSSANYIVIITSTESGTHEGRGNVELVIPQV